MDSLTIPALHFGGQMCCMLDSLLKKKLPCYLLQLPLSGGNFSLPLETAALYFNMSEIFVNGSVASANHTHSKLIRTAVVSQKFKTLAVTLSRNVSRSVVNFTLSGKSHDKAVTVSATHLHVM